MIVALDIETECALGCKTECQHALDEYRNRVSVIGLWYKDGGETHSLVLRSVDALSEWVHAHPDSRFVGHNFKFDLKTLDVKGLKLVNLWRDDTLLMAATSLDKVSLDYLEWYASERKRLNKLRPKGHGHREGKPNSLKVLAPYFLGVEPFWEPVSHDDDTYVLKDVEYTYRLYEFFEAKLRAEGTYEFYKDWYVPRAKLLFKMERRGISLDWRELDKADEVARLEATEAKRQLDECWAGAYRKYWDEQRGILHSRYWDMELQAIKKLKDPAPERVDKVRKRYGELFEKAATKLEPLSLDSPAQLTWLLKEHLKLDITDFDGEETTGKAVLEKLAGQGREDVAKFIEYREATKLTSAFFPSYREKQVEGRIHCTFNPAGTRTGRLSSSGPNLQQIERSLKRLFVPRPGYKLIVYDEGAIEPRLILYYTQDVNLFDIISKGKDYHNYNTAIFFGLDSEEPGFKKKYALEREVGKEVGLSLKYGSGEKRLMESAQKRGFVWSKREARYKVDQFREFYEGVYRFRDETINPVLIAGGAVTNIMGRQFVIEDPSNVHLQGFNTLIQGGASDLVWNSAYKADRQFCEEGLDAHILVLEHDCIVAEAREEHAERAEEIVTHAMTDYQLKTPLGLVPLTVEGGIMEAWSK